MTKRRKKKVGRNAPCPCGSGKKYKKCCGSSLNVDEKLQQQIKMQLEQRQADELIRQQQQGLGRPIICAKFKGNQFVAVGNQLYHSPKWKTFPDFLSGYLKLTLGTEWGDAELRKPYQKRHPILQWYHEYCLLQRNDDRIEAEGEIKSYPMTGVVYCYLGLAYNLYLLKHNVELQERLIKRLKNRENFQGAYYELMVANSLIRAGFELVLEDETDRSEKHCEFAAISKKTGKRYWVEAKMRAVVGQLGKTKNDGTENADPTSTLIKHLNGALKKTAENERFIFIDLNTEPSDAKPQWADKAFEKIERHEGRQNSEQRAYVFITNLPFHHSLREENIGISILGHGLCIPDFAKPGVYRLREIYRQKQNHIDAHDVMEALKSYPKLPATFDGSLPSRLKGNPYDRIIIGESYFFEGIGGDKGEIATVTSACVNEKEKIAYIGTSDGRVLTKQMSEDEMDDYRSHPEAYFGIVQRRPKEAKSYYELFEFFLGAYKNTSKERLLELMKDAPDIDLLKNMNQADLAIEYCERTCAVIANQNKDQKP